MSDVNIPVSVEDSAVDSAIAKLDSALEKLAQVQLQTANLDTSLLTPAVAASKSGAAVGSVAGVGAGVAGLSTAQATVDKLKGDVAETTSAVGKLTNLSETTDVKGLQSAAYRITRMVPGLREAHRLTIAMKNITSGSVVGWVSLFLLLISIINQVMSVLAAQERERLQYQRDVMNAQNFTMKAEFAAWELKTQRALAAYKSKPLPK